MLSIKEYIDKTEEAALAQCLEDLKKEESELYIRKSETEAKLFKSKKVKVEVLEKSEVISYIKDYLSNLSDGMNLEIKAEIKENEGRIEILLVSDNNGILIGKDGRTMNSIQHLLRQSISIQTGFNLKITVDVSNYKEKQNYFFEKDIKQICKEVLENHVEVKLDSMNSYKRRLVHNLVSKYNELETESLGEEPHRYVVIRYKED